MQAIKIACVQMNCAMGDREAHLNDKRIGMTVEQFRTVRRRIAAAAGEHKAETIVGAIRTRVLSELVTDSLTARRVLDLYDPKETN